MTTLHDSGVFDENDNRFFEMPEFIEMLLDFCLDGDIPESRIPGKVAQAQNSCELSFKKPWGQGV